MRRLRGLVAILSVSLAACSGKVLIRPAEMAHAAKLVVYREPAFNAGASNLFFGEDEVRYVKLRSHEYSVLDVGPGKHSFFVSANAHQAFYSKEFYFDADLKPGSTTCIRAYANPANYAKMLMPILMSMTRIFKAEIVECPADTFFAKYDKVE